MAIFMGLSLPQRQVMTAEGKRYCRRNLTDALGNEE